jgi:hypothetical protein
MSTIGLKEDVLELIKTDPILHGKVAAVLGVVSSSLTRLLLQNHPKLTQAAVLQTIKEHQPSLQEAELLNEVLTEQK